MVLKKIIPSLLSLLLSFPVWAQTSVVAPGPSTGITNPTSTIPTPSPTDMNNPMSGTTNGVITEKPLPSVRGSADKVSSRDGQTIQRIRQNLLKDEIYAADSNRVNILSSNGQVTIQGQVRSQEERERILRSVQNSAGNSRVINQLEIRPL